MTGNRCIRSLQYRPDSLRRNYSRSTSRRCWVDGLQGHHHKMGGHETNDGDTSRPNFRSSLIGREVKLRQETRSLFRNSTTGDAEVLVFHVCKRSDTARAISLCRHRHQALVRRPIFNEIPKEDVELGDEGCVGQLQ